MKKEMLIILIIFLVILGIYLLNYSTSGNIILSKDKFCGRSSFAYCTSEEQCIPGGCGYQLCGANTEYKAPLKSCKTKDCYNATKYNLKCTCYKNLCQWRK